MYDSSPLLSAIQALALKSLPGAMVLAEHAVDLHLAPFVAPHERLTALDALAGDLIGFGRTEPGLAPFLGQVGSYVLLLQGTLAAEATGR